MKENKLQSYEQTSICMYERTSVCINVRQEQGVIEKQDCLPVIVRFGNIPGTHIPFEEPVEKHSGAKLIGTVPLGDECMGKYSSIDSKVS
jgi:hypothetical protein